MKKIITGLFLLAIGLGAQSQTADEILTKYEAAAGGREKLEGVKMLEVNSNLKMDMMGRPIEISLTMVREKGKLFRRQIGGVMGMGDSFTMITDTSGYLYIPPMRSGFGGGPGGPGGGSDDQPTIVRLSDADVAAQQYELDCNGGFPELVNYAAKGHKAELIGTEKISKVPCYKVKVTLKTGQVVMYYFDTQTFLVKQMEATGDMAANLSGFGSMMKAFGRTMKKDDKATIVIKEYQDFAGIKYPSKMLLTFGPIQSEVTNYAVKVNEGIDEKYYHVNKKY